MIYDNHPPDRTRHPTERTRERKQTNVRCHWSAIYCLNNFKLLGSIRAAKSSGSMDTAEWPFTQAKHRRDLGRMQCSKVVVRSFRGRLPARAHTYTQIHGSGPIGRVCENNVLSDKCQLNLARCTQSVSHSLTEEETRIPMAVVCTRRNSHSHLPVADTDHTERHYCVVK